MNRVLRLVDVAISNAPESAPAPVSTMLPTLAYTTLASLRPTLSPSTRATVRSALTGSFATEPPPTQRSVTSHPRYETAARHEATNLLAVMRLNLDFVQALLYGESSGLAASALADLHQTIDRLERRLATPPFSR